MTLKACLPWSGVLASFLALHLLTPPTDSRAADPAFQTLGGDYDKNIRPLLQRHCNRCHSAKKPEGDIDLSSQTTLAHVRKSPRAWQKVLEMLDSRQMPPPESKQPTEAERAKLVGWVRSYLAAEAKAQDGDPGPVVLRRLNNAEYTYTIRDLTGVDLDPARQFPVDSAAGEGFSNTGQSLVMSPAMLTKYLDAAKEIAAHAVLLPDGIRFSPSTTRRDWTNETLARIRQTYRDWSDSQGATRVNLQGIVFDTNDGGRLPLARYLIATIVERDSLKTGKQSIAEVARKHHLNEKYLSSLWKLLTSSDSSALIARLGERWRSATPAEVPGIVAEVEVWQKALTRFQNVGHMKAWMAPVIPLVTRQEVRAKIPESAGKEVALFLASATAGDGAAHDVVVWQQPRLVIPGRADLPLRDVRAFVSDTLAWRERLFGSTAKCLAAAAEASRSRGPIEPADLARKHGVDVQALEPWLAYLGIGAQATPKLDLFTSKLPASGGYDFVRGWGSGDTPNLVANSSNRHVRIPGNMKPHGVCVHPSPTLQAGVGWRSPVAANVRIEGKVTHAHPECGNGVTWSLELRRGATRRRLAAGISHGSRPVQVGPIASLDIHKGDLLSLLIGPRDGNHSCDLTDIELTVRATGDSGKEWSLNRDVADDVLAGNPHSDRHGNRDVWYFYTEPVRPGDGGQVIPGGSVLDRWIGTEDPAQKQKLAEGVQNLLQAGPPADPKHPDAILHRLLASAGGPLLRGKLPKASTEAGFSIDPARFGKHLDGSPIDATSLCVQAPSYLEVRLPADLFAGAELVATGVLDGKTGAEGSVQLRILAGKSENLETLRPDGPILVAEGSQSRKRWERAFEDFRKWFPIALCYTKIVPVDEVVTLTLYHREDEPLCRLMLDDRQKAQLDRLWEELHFVSHDALTLVDAYKQLMEYATQDSDPKLFEPFRKPIHDRAAAFRKALVDAEPRHVEAVVGFAEKAYRRPLVEREKQELRRLYQQMREQNLPHEMALRLTLARVFVAPSFLYRLEKAPEGPKQGPVSGWELASRLSYFLWSSQPDATLRQLAAEGKLNDPDILVAQGRRMLKDERTRRLGIEFGCTWLHIHAFDKLDEKSERHFPTFAAMRGPMYEEAIRLMTDLFQNDRTVASLLDGDHTYLDETLAKHYGIPGVAGPEWRLVSGVKKYGRGGILGLGATLAKQSGASRTSPILRGNWVSEVLLGEKLPRPPKNVPQLPEDEATTGLTVRQLVEKHSSDPRCATCHVRVDPLGFALEGYDAIGRRRDVDLGNRKLDLKTKVKDGTPIEGIEGLKGYLLERRRADIVRQFCRKLLGYALGRGVQLSDEPLLDEMQRQLTTKGDRVSALIETILRSRQFREIRGRTVVEADAH